MPVNGQTLEGGDSRVERTQDAMCSKPKTKAMPAGALVPWFEGRTVNGVRVGLDAT